METINDIKMIERLAEIENQAIDLLSKLSAVSGELDGSARLYVVSDSMKVLFNLANDARADRVNIERRARDSRLSESSV